MPQVITTYQFAGENKITALLVDDTGTGKFIWVAYEGSGGSTVLQKRNAFDPNQLFFDITLPVDGIVRMVQDASFIYLAVNHSTRIGYRISKTNPLSSQTILNRPTGIVEVPVDLAIISTNLYFLTPGIVTGQLAKVSKMTTAGVFDENVDLTDGMTDITDASGITAAGTDLWVVTNTSPVYLVRIFPVGATFDVAITPIV